MLLQPLSSKQDRDKIKEQEREVPYRHFFLFFKLCFEWIRSGLAPLDPDPQWQYGF
jgi:hypothetical protein